MSKITLLEYGEQTIRIVHDDQGQRWFVVADVCKCLQLAIHKQSGKPNVTVATRAVDARHKQLSRIDTPENPRNPWTDMMTLSEAGLDSMLSHLDSPEAKRFQTRIQKGTGQPLAESGRTVRALKFETYSV